MRVACLTLLGAVLSLTGPGIASADLLPPLPPPPDLGGTVGGVLTDTGITTTVDGILGGGSTEDPGGGDTTGGTTSGGGGATSGGGDAGGTNGGETTGTPASAGTLTTTGSTADTRAPRVTLKVVSTLAWSARTGRLKLRVGADERAVVAVSGRLRAGRKLLRLPQRLLGYRAPGTVMVSVRLPAKARRALAHARRARLSLQTLAVDVARNEARSSFKRTLTRAREVAHFRPARRSAAPAPLHTRR